jgi:hypothetical protein
MISSFLNTFRGDSGLVAKIGSAILELFSGVEFL